MSEPQPSKKRNVAVIIAAVLVVLIAAGLVYFREQLKGSRALITPKGASSGLPSRKVAQKPMSVPAEPPTLAVRLDVNKAKDVRQAIETNAWLQDALASSLGRGLASGWTAFLSSKGEDLSASFKGSVASFLLDKVLAEPFSLAWFGGSTASGAPALIIEGSRSARSAAETMNQVAERGGYTATHCPGEEPPEAKKDKDGKDIPPESRLSIARWLVGEHAVFAGVNAERVVLGSKPTAVLQGLCVQLGEHKRGSAALEAIVSPVHIGREAQALAALIGVGDEVRFAIDVEQGKLVPKGVSAALSAQDRLAVMAPSDELLKLLPVDVPVVAVLALNLPEALSAEAIAAHMKGDKIKRVQREVALVWAPHGGAEATDIALVWGRPEDESALSAIFSGANPLRRSKACAHLILASTAAAAERLERACSGKVPSRKNADPAVVSGTKAPASVGLDLHLGSLLAGLMLEAYRAEQPPKAQKAPLPPELEQAKSKLEALPFFGFRGRAQGDTLVAEGFRS